jgi:hypothetical protein
MKRLVAVSLMLAVNLAHAGLEKSPYDKFNLSKLMTASTNVNIYPVDNIQQTCEKESKSRGYGGFGKTPFDACSFWSRGLTGHNCDIFVPKLANNDILGHELHHCVSGAFH